MATSGDYRNFYEVGGRVYSHTIDPRTGRPVKHPPASVTVVAGDCMTADAAATAVMALGPRDGYNWAARRGLAVLVLTRDGEAITERATPAFESAFPHPSDPSDGDMADSGVTIWLIAFGVFLAAVLLMAVGVILSNRRIAGSCGGLGRLRDERGRPVCDACAHPADDCGGVAEGLARDADAAPRDAGERGT
jgi:thiamine biosynthesis lipoprotein